MKPAKANPQKLDECPTAVALGMNSQFIEIPLTLEPGLLLTAEPFLRRTILLFLKQRPWITCTTATVALNFHIDWQFKKKSTSTVFFVSYFSFTYEIITLISQKYRHRPVALRAAYWAVKPVSPYFLQCVLHRREVFLWNVVLWKRKNDVAWNVNDQTKPEFVLLYVCTFVYLFAENLLWQ